MRPAFLAAFVAVLAGCAASPAPEGGGSPAPTGPDLAWGRLSGPSVERSEASCAALGSDVLLLGGFDAAGVTASVELFNGTRGAWSTAPSLPVGLHHAFVAGVGATWYVFGGYVSPQFVAQETAWKLEPGATAWEPIASVPAPRAAGGAAVVDGEVWLVGGAVRSAPAALTTVVHVYDPEANAWRTGPDLPTPRDHLAVGALGDRIYAAGGRALTLDSNVATLEILDVPNARWSKGADLPAARGGVGGAATSFGFVVVGGEASPSVVHDAAEVFNPEAGAWFAAPSLPSPLHGVCAVGVGNAAHVVTGSSKMGLPPGISDVHYVLTET